MENGLDTMFQVSSNPHVRAKDTTSRIMLYVVIALLPATVFGVFNFGFHALLLVIVTVLTTVFAEYIYGRCMKKNITVMDFSAVVTGLLLALNLPPDAPLWIGVIGGAFAIIVVKMLFGRNQSGRGCKCVGYGHRAYGRNDWGNEHDCDFDWRGVFACDESD